MKDEPMEIILSDKENSNSRKSTLYNPDEVIFGKNFQVENMTNPGEFLPRYQQSQDEEVSLVQDCNVCCGKICICLSYPFALCCCKCSCVYELETSKAGLIEEFGKFKRLMTPGFNMINPCSEDVFEVDLKIRLLPVGNHSFITKDNVKVNVKASISYRIYNPILSHYVLGDQASNAIAQLTVASLRTAVGEDNLEQVLVNRSKVVGLAKQLVKEGLPAGLEVDRIFMEDLVIPADILTDLSSAAKQRRISESNIINSKADVESANLLKEAAELLDTKAAMQIRYLEMVQELGKKGVTLMMPIGVEKKGYKK